MGLKNTGNHVNVTEYMPEIALLVLWILICNLDLNSIKNPGRKSR